MFKILNFAFSLSGTYKKGVKLIHSNIAGVAKEVYPDLVVLDCMHGMEGDGPIDGTSIYLGAAVASADALQQGDWVAPAFREHALTLVRGMPLKNFYLYYMGNEIGSVVPKDTRILPVSVPVGSHPIHAVGIAWASKIKKEKTVAITYFGDGATSEGEFHEAMNFAGESTRNLLLPK